MRGRNYPLAIELLQARAPVALVADAALIPLSCAEGLAEALQREAAGAMVCKTFGAIVEIDGRRFLPGAGR